MYISFWERVKTWVNHRIQGNAFLMILLKNTEGFPGGISDK